MKFNKTCNKCGPTTLIFQAAHEGYGIVLSPLGLVSGSGWEGRSPILWRALTLEEHPVSAFQVRSPASVLLSVGGTLARSISFLLCRLTENVGSV